ncbi:hypothetical protein ACLOJK_022799, partial [Asimina triloba]
LPVARGRDVMRAAGTNGFVMEAIGGCRRVDACGPAVSGRHDAAGCRRPLPWKKVDEMVECRTEMGVMDGQIWLFFVGSSDERGEL